MQERDGEKRGSNQRHASRKQLCRGAEQRGDRRNAGAHRQRTRDEDQQRLERRFGNRRVGDRATDRALDPEHDRIPDRRQVHEQSRPVEEMRVPIGEGAERDIDDHFFVGAGERVGKAECQPPHAQERSCRDHQHEERSGCAVGQAFSWKFAHRSKSGCQ